MVLWTMLPGKGPGRGGGRPRSSRLGASLQTLSSVDPLASWVPAFAGVCCPTLASPQVMLLRPLGDERCRCRCHLHRARVFPC